MDDESSRRRPEVRGPKYLFPDFMRKEIALFHQARMQTQLMRRYGDNDSPVPPVMKVASVQGIRPIRRTGRI